VTATFGNVTEPYLELTHQPQLILRALARGDTLGDAAAYAVPVYSWQAIMVGDPLYRPFKVSFAEQWARRDKFPPESQAYLVLRRMRELERAGRRDAAIWAGVEAQKTRFSLAVALAITDLQKAAGDTAGMRQNLEGAAKRRNFTTNEAPLAVMLARRLGETGDAKAAFVVWMNALANRNLSKDTRVQWLPEAREAANRAGETRQSLRWDEEHRDLTAPPPAPDANKK
jgi:hypothetical protein